MKCATGADTFVPGGHHCLCWWTGLLHCIPAQRSKGLSKDLLTGSSLYQPLQLPGHEKPWPIGLQALPCMGHFVGVLCRSQECVSCRRVQCRGCCLPVWVYTCEHVCVGWRYSIRGVGSSRRFTSCSGGWSTVTAPPRGCKLAGWPPCIGDQTILVAGHCFKGDGVGAHVQPCLLP